MMSNYSKLIGTVVGWVIGYLAGILIQKGILPPDAADADTLNQLAQAITTLIGGMAGTYFAPANRAG